MKWIKKLWKWAYRKWLCLKSWNEPYPNTIGTAASSANTTYVVPDRILDETNRPLSSVGPITEHLSGSTIDISRLPAPLKPWQGPLKSSCDPWFGTDLKLPRVCPLCSGPTVPSKIDDRVVACYACKQVYMTEEAFADPNVQRDITHVYAGISCSGRNDFNDRDDCEDQDEKND